MVYKYDSKGESGVGGEPSGEVEIPREDSEGPLDGAVASVAGADMGGVDAELVPANGIGWEV